MRTLAKVLLLLALTCPARCAIGELATLERDIETRLTALFQEKDVLATDHAVLLASEYRRLKLQPRPPAEHRAALVDLLARCQAPAPRNPAPGELVRVDAPPLVDAGDLASLRTALSWALNAARRDARAKLPFGLRTVRRADLVASLELFARHAAAARDGADLARRVKKDFDVYRSPGLSPSGQVLYTAYHDPVFEGRERADATHRYPVYRPPTTAGIANERFTRAEVARGALAGKGLEIVWLADPLDAFLLEVEGSGLVRLPDGRCVKLEFAAKNGQPYRSLGKTMVRLGMISAWEMSIPAIRRALKAAPARLRETLDTNPSQVYFKATILPHLPRTLEYIAQRSVACDQSYFPRAGIGFASLERPDVGPDGETRGWTAHRRFIVNHDTGSAIRGPGHIDLYWGHAVDSGVVAGLMREPGELYHLLKRGTVLSRR